MKLYTFSPDTEVQQRWHDFSDEYECIALEPHHLVSTNCAAQGIGLIHIDSVDSQSVAQLPKRYPGVRWVALAHHPDDGQGLAMLELGYRGYINTYVTRSLFAVLLKTVREGDIWAGPGIVQRLLKAHVGGTHMAGLEQQRFNLTERESQVLEWLKQGAANKEIAKALAITERTVKAHVTSILKKTQTKDRFALIVKLTGQVA